MQRIRAEFRHDQAPADRFLMPDRMPLLDPDGIIDPICLSEPSRLARLRASARQAGEALAVIGSIVAVGLLAVVL